MKEPADHPQEAERLRALENLNLIGTPAEQRFDMVTTAARKLFNVPIALFSLVTAELQCFKSGSGLAEPDTPRAVSFCGHAILTPDLFIIPDTLKDPRFADNPLVTGRPEIRFYAGCPIYSPEGLPLGTLCIIDTRPRHLDIFERKQLKALGKWLTTEVRNRGLSEAELELLSARASEGQAFIEPYSKCWNRKAADFLLAHILDRANSDSRVAALLLDFRPMGGEWSDHSPSVISASHACQANLLRQMLPDDQILIHLGNARFLALLKNFTAGDPEAWLENLAGELEPASSRMDVPAAVRIALRPDLPHEGRLKREVLNQLEEVVEEMPAGSSLTLQDSAPGLSEAVRPQPQSSASATH